MAKSDSYNISMTTVKLSVASPGLRRPGREVREQYRTEHVDVGVAPFSPGPAATHPATPGPGTSGAMAPVGW